VLPGGTLKAASGHFLVASRGAFQKTMTTSTTPRSAPSTERLSDVVIRFAGDSGDGMQLTGTQFTSTSAFLGNDLSTLPDFPAEIRAPAGTLPGVSAFQIRIADFDIHTPGDSPNVLVAMNPAALKVNLIDLERGGVLVVDTDEFTTRNLKRIGYETNPLEDGSLDGYRVFALPLTTLTKQAVAEAGLDTRNQIRCKNFYALGMCYWLFSRSLEHTERWLAKKFAGKAQLLDGNLRALRAGWTYCDVTEAFQVRYEVEPAKLEPGLYRNVNGNQALAWGLVAGGRLSGLPVFLGSYPITPASDLLHTLAGMRRYGVTTFQAEDEIAAVCAAIGAAFGGALGVTSTSGPGLALKMEAINLAVMTELPLVVVDVMRAGPSTGMPTKTEQSDLLQALFGRNGESPVAVVAPGSPGDCFTIAIEACRLAVEYRVPVIVLSDGYLGNGAEPWRVPSVADLPRIEPNFTTNPEGFQPYSRDPETLARPWAIPGTPGSNTASVASKRRTDRATCPPTRATTRRWLACGPRRSSGWHGPSHRSQSTTRMAPTCWCSAGAAPRVPSWVRSTRLAGVATVSHGRTCGIFRRSRQTSVRFCGRTARCCCPR
jgi:2-oxoglutarate ferredoxin oxidoreductase subunit alpha